ncbi:hypothetical protein C2S51_013661 [Perilla frutescens var. frutescens]|nr:hypothetical protein C2S51_013661 [Perilla frutescens var. frutescens]
MKRGTMTLGIDRERVIVRNPPRKDIPQCDDVSLAHSFMDDVNDKPEEKLMMKTSPTHVPKAPKTQLSEMCMVLQDNGGFSAAQAPKKMRVKFRVFRKKNMKGAMLVAVAPEKPTVAVDSSPRKGRQFCWLECCFRPR